MTKSYLMPLLMMGTIAAATSCSPKPKSKTETSSQPPAKIQVMRVYSDPGKTDADHMWLEEVEGEQALNKVKAWNERSAKIMRGETYQAIKDDLLKVYNSPEKIPYGSYRKGLVHNFWQDADHVRGIWRTTTLESYMSKTPKWDTVLDIDALAKSEDKNWVYKGNNCLPPEYDRCIVNLSIGGKDAVERREFDVPSKSFVAKGFALPESKGSTSWLDRDDILVGVDFGEGTLTDSGYPNITKLWRRGTDIGSARELIHGETTDVGTWPASFEMPDGSEEILIVRAATFYESEYYWIPRTGEAAFKPVKLPVPKQSSLADQFGDQQLLTLQEDWRGYKSGALVSFAWSDFMKDGKIDTVHEVITPGPRQSIGNFGATKSKVLLSLYDNVSGVAMAFDYMDGKWSSKKLDFPDNGSVSISSTNSKEDVGFIETESFLEPTTLWKIDTSDMSVVKARALPSWFDASTMVAEQHEATSTDGVKIPYYVVHNKDMKLDGTNPTLLYGYGGFEISINPNYSATIGRAWLERGGVYAVANIRGGGEFGPKWHQAGLKTKRQIVYDDFIAVGTALIDQKITSPEHLGIHGRSNGGLLMGVMFTQRPDLFGAVVVGVPLLDMRRYNKLLAGASWVGEYGDPDQVDADGNPTAEAKFIRGLSPYHNIDPEGTYPVPFIYTSTKDDRVHPGHARKFAQRLEDYGYDFLYYENIDGGHAGAANLEETASSQALIYSYLWDKLK